jgi:hypothetical protein
MRVFQVEPKGSRHAEVEDELEILIQRSDHELPPATDSKDPPSWQQLQSHELTRDSRMGIPPDILDPPVRQLRFELPANGFDLGKLRHGIRLLAIQPTARTCHDNQPR